MSTDVVYIGPLKGVVTPDGTQFPKGVPVPVSDELAAALLLQAFVDATPTTTTPTTSPATSFTAPAAAPAPTTEPAPDPTSVASDPTPTPEPDQTATVLAPVSGVAA